MAKRSSKTRTVRKPTAVASPVAGGVEFQEVDPGSIKVAVGGRRSHYDNLAKAIADAKPGKVFRLPVPDDATAKSFKDRVVAALPRHRAKGGILEGVSYSIRAIQDDDKAIAVIRN